MFVQLIIVRDVYKEIKSLFGGLRRNRMNLNRLILFMEREEIWVDVIGYEGLYKISNRGSMLSYLWGYEVKIVTNKLVNNTCDRYVKVRLGGVKFGKKRISVKVHKLVALHFVPNPNNLPEVNHKDGDRNNNNDWNLEWTTHRENVNHGGITKGKVSKFVGVSKKSKTTWVSRIYLNKKHICIGYFDTEEKASKAYQSFLKENGISLKYVA